MKNLIKKFTPDFLKPLVYSDFVLKFYRRKYRKAIMNKTTDEVFSYIYKNNIWGDKESISGSGSNFQQTQEVISILNRVIKRLDVKVLLDVPCGDFNWMQKVNLSGITYIGGDIVQEIVNENNRKFRSENVQFDVIDLISSLLPEADLLFCRDCFVHLSNAMVQEALANIKRSKIKYLLTTSFPLTNDNKDIITGEWRALNMELDPFNLAKLEIYNERCTEQEQRTYSDKSLILVKL